MFLVLFQGLLDAFADLISGDEQHHCVKHLHANFKSKGYKGEALKYKLWDAARAHTRCSFEHHMQSIKNMKSEAHKYLDDINPSVWSQHAIRTTTKCDMLLNNIADTFNSWI